MRFLNFGSLNIDYVFGVDHIVYEGETITADSQNVNIGGKGLNQSIALARAGAVVCHGGMTGSDGVFLKSFLKANGVDTSFIKTVEEKTGSAFIQVDAKGHNSIVVAGGANRKIDSEFADYVLGFFGEGDVLLVQNEISSVNVIMTKAKEKGMTVVFNPSPADNVEKYPLENVDMFILNEHECKELCGYVSSEKLIEKFPGSKVVLTMGESGAVFSDGENRYYCEAEKVKAVDTTGAGDTFTGYFLKEYFENHDAESALKTAAHASAIAVTRNGAAQSIPLKDEL